MTQDSPRFGAEAGTPDRCPACGGIWLDHDELEALLRLAAEREDGAFLNGVILDLAW